LAKKNAVDDLRSLDQSRQHLAVVRRKPGDVRSDLGGLNLSTVPKVFIECGNMRDTKDAALLTSGAWRQKAAQGISEGIVSFLRG